MIQMKASTALGWLFTFLTLLSFGYGFGLAITNISHPGLVELLAHKLSVVTEPFASLLPMTKYANQLANPHIFLSAALIRHVVPLLLIVNGSAGLFCLIWLPRVSLEYAALLESDLRPFARSWWTWLCLWVLSVCVLFIIPTIEIGFTFSSQLSLVAYILDLIAPSLVVFGTYKLAAMMWASERDGRSELHIVLPQVGEIAPPVEPAPATPRDAPHMSHVDVPRRQTGFEDKRLNSELADVYRRSTISVVTTVVDAYRSLFGAWLQLAATAWPVVLLFVAIDLVLWRSNQGVNAHQSLGVSLTLRGLGWLQSLLLVGFSVRWHELALFTTQDSVPRGLYLRATWRFVFYLILLFLLVGVPVGAMVSALGGGRLTAIQFYIIFLVAMWSLGSRFALLFPAAVFGDPLRWREAWQSLRGNALRLMGSLFLACLPILLIAAYVIAILSWFIQLAHHAHVDLRAPWQWSAIDSLVDVMSKVLMIALATTIVCKAYRRLVLFQEP